MSFVASQGLGFVEIVRMRKIEKKVQALTFCYFCGKTKVKKIIILKAIISVWFSYAIFFVVWIFEMICIFLNHC